MNHKLISEQEKQANRKRRNKKRTYRRQRRVYEHVLNSLSSLGPAAAYCCRDHDTAIAIMYGTTKERRKTLRDLQARVSTLGVPTERLWTLVAHLKLAETDCEAPKYELVLSGGKWRRRKYQPLIIW